MRRARLAAVYLYYLGVHMVGKASGRPSEYDDEEDAILLNTTGEGPDYTNEVLELVGKPRRSRYAINSRRQLVEEKTRQATRDETERLVKVNQLEAQLKARLAVLEAEKAKLYEELGLIPPASNGGGDGTPRQ